MLWHVIILPGSIVLVALNWMLFESTQFTDHCIGQFSVTISYHFTSLYSVCTPKLPNPLQKSAIILFSGTGFCYQILSQAELELRTYVAVYGNMLYCASKSSRVWPSTWKILFAFIFSVVTLLTNSPVSLKSTENERVQEKSRSNCSLWFTEAQYNKLTQNYAITTAQNINSMGIGTYDDFFFLKP